MEVDYDILLIVCDPRGILEKQPRPYTAHLLIIILILLIYHIKLYM